MIQPGTEFTEEGPASPYIQIVRGFRHAVAWTSVTWRVRKAHPRLPDRDMTMVPVASTLSEKEIVLVRCPHCEQVLGVKEDE